MPEENAVDLLNGLLRISRDGEEGFRAAAENVRNSELDTVFSGYAQQRAAFARELAAEIKRLGGEPDDSGTLGGAAHRGWMDVKSALSGGSAGAIIAACESGEDSAEAAYARAADTGISGKTRALVDSQWQKIKETHTRLRRLKAEIADGAEFQKNE